MSSAASGGLRLSASIQSSSLLSHRSSSRRASCEVYQPKIEPTLSENEIVTYSAMLDGILEPICPSMAKNVVVVGAGLAGLAAAREFQKAGMHVVILEATNRVGGRCYTMDSPEFSDGVYGEAGGMRFCPDSHKILMKYIEMFELEMLPFANMKDKDGLLFFDGVKTATQQELGDHDSLLSRVVAKWEESIAPLRQAWKSGAVSWQEIIKSYANVSLLQFLESEGWSAELIDGFSKYGLGLGAYGAILGLSFIEILRLFVESYESGNFQLKGGMESLAKAFLFDADYPLKESVRYRCKVASVEETLDGRYFVSYWSESAGSHMSVACDFCVLTCPLPCLSKINFDPPLPDTVQTAINETHYVRSIKIFLQTKSTFWLNHGVDGMLVSDTPLKNTYFVPPFEGSKKGLIIASYTWEDHADFFLGMPDERKIEIAVQELSKIFPEMRDEYERGAAIEWQNGFCIFRPGQMDKFHATLRDEVCPNVFLAGEHCSVEHGYFEGALESGLRAAANVFRRIDHTYYARFNTMLKTGNRRGTIQRLRSSIVRLLFDDTNLTVRSLGVDDLNGEEKTVGSLDALSIGQNFHFYGNGSGNQIDSTPQRPTITDIQVKRLDHYTLICKDARAVADFHVQVLGFSFVRIQKVNTGTVKEGEIDMLNYILSPPANPDIVMVVTEGLNDDTIFRKYVKKFGPGIHHLAFEVDNVDKAFGLAKKANIKTTTDRVTTDMLSGLKQFFIEPCHGGFFVELIERRSGTTKIKAPKLASKNTTGFFTQNNMANLANSIKGFVETEQPTVATTSDSLDTSSVSSSDASSSASSALSIGDIKAIMCGFSVGELMSVKMKVDAPARNAVFLTNMLGFQVVRYENFGGQIHLKIPGTTKPFSLCLEQATELSEDHYATVSFNFPQVHRVKEDPAYSKAFRLGANGAQMSLPPEYASYHVQLASPEVLSTTSQTVHSCGTELHVHIGTHKSAIIDFLRNPLNLGKWTGHRALHFSSKEKEWVETRVDSNGCLVNSVLKVDVIGDSRVRFHWPARKVSIRFDCLEKTQRCCTLVVQLPNSLNQGRLARLQRMISLELEILKALLEDKASTIPDRFWHQLQQYHLKVYGPSMVKSCFCDVSAEEFGFLGEVVTSGSLVDQMSTDFALTIHSKPQALLRPTNVQDVVAAVRMATALNLQLAARGSQVSHSAGGQAQADGGLLLDMSCLSDIAFSPDDSLIHVGAGCMWDKVIRATLDRGVMPPVINDYQYLSVGGTISMGGVGFMSHKSGIQAGHVEELEIVTGKGDIMICSHRNNKDLFDRARAGLGQFGVITSLSLPLIEAPREIAIFKGFYRQMDTAVFAQEIEALVDDGRIDMIHAFLKASSRSSISAIVGAEAFESSSEAFREQIDRGHANGEVVIFIEIGVYIRDSKTGIIDDIEAMFSKLSTIQHESFKLVDHFYNYVTRDPPVVETNKKHGAIPHPSFATIVDRKVAMSVVDHHLNSKEGRGDDSLNEILIIPMKSNANVRSGYHVPMFPMPNQHEKDNSMSFFLLFLGSVLPNESRNEQMQKLRDHHESIFQFSQSVGGKRYSYDTVTNSVVGEQAWKAHFGADTFHKVCVGKQHFDPFHVLCPGIPMWDY